MKKETRLSVKIRKLVKEKYGTILHKNHGGPFTETGAADLYGTLPGGRAVYIELKTPETVKQKSGRATYQYAWLERERKLGALTMLISSFEELVYMFTAAGVIPIVKDS